MQRRDRVFVTYPIMGSTQNKVLISPLTALGHCITWCTKTSFLMDWSRNWIIVYFCFFGLVVMDARNGPSWMCQMIRWQRFRHKCSIYFYLSTSLEEQHRMKQTPTPQRSQDFSHNFHLSPNFVLFICCGISGALRNWLWRTKKGVRRINLVCKMAEICFSLVEG